MKAYMSGGETRCTGPVVPTFGVLARDVEASEREARIILSETQAAVWGEEKTLDFLAARHEERWPDFPCIDCAAGLALIEALAAFVGDAQ